MMTEGKVVNEGLAMMAETCRQNGQIRKAELYGMLACLDENDICTLYDSTVFNLIASGYLRHSLAELVENGTITVDQQEDIQRHFRLLHDEMTASQVMG